MFFPNLSGSCRYFSNKDHMWYVVKPGLEGPPVLFLILVVESSLFRRVTKATFFSVNSLFWTLNKYFTSVDILVATWQGDSSKISCPSQQEVVLGTISDSHSSDVFVRRVRHYWIWNGTGFPPTSDLQDVLTWFVKVVDHKGEIV